MGFEGKIARVDTRVPTIRSLGALRKEREGIVTAFVIPSCVATRVLSFLMLSCAYI